MAYCRGGCEGGGRITSSWNVVKPSAQGLPLNSFTATCSPRHLASHTSPDAPGESRSMRCCFVISVGLISHADVSEAMLSTWRAHVHEDA